MTTQATLLKQSHASSSDAYRAEALALADRGGIRAAAKDLGIQASQRYQWRAKAAGKFKATTYSTHSLPVAPNLLKQKFQADPLVRIRNARGCLNRYSVWWAGSVDGTLFRY